jgi:hypothetical protein
VPPLQVRLALARVGQLFVQVPHLLTSVFVLVSQPLVSLPSQFPQPALQLLMAQVPVEQVAVALLRVHAVLQLPQCVVVVVWVSQPLLTSLSQLPRSGLHWIAQEPRLQLAVPPVVLQAWPQPPQLVTLVWMLTSQPSAVRLLQFRKSPLQLTIWQVRVAQLAVALAGLQGTAQAPQLVSVFSGVSQPLSAFPSQLSKPEPGVQVMLQTLALQDGVPLTVLQTLPQLPQFWTSALVSTQVLPHFV